jgi:hypothetical protein
VLQLTSYVYEVEMIKKTVYAAGCVVMFGGAWGMRPLVDVGVQTELSGLMTSDKKTTIPSADSPILEKRGSGKLQDVLKEKEKEEASIGESRVSERRGSESSSEEDSSDQSGDRSGDESIGGTKEHIKRTISPEKSSSAPAQSSQSGEEHEITRVSVSAPPARVGTLWDEMNEMFRMEPIMLPGDATKTEDEKVAMERQEEIHPVGKIVVPNDPLLSRAELRKAVIVQVLEQGKTDGQKTAYSEHLSFEEAKSILPKFVITGSGSLANGGEPDFYTASFLIEILSKPDDLLSFVIGKEQWMKLSIEEKNVFSKESSASMMKLSDEFDKKYKELESHA